MAARIDKIVISELAATEPVWWGASGEAVLTHVLPFLHIGASTDHWFLAQRITVKSPIYRDLVAKSKYTCKKCHATGGKNWDQSQFTYLT